MKTLGIIGGMGPEATIYMFKSVVSMTEANRDQNHIEVVIHNNSRVPDRTQAILEGGPSPVPELMRSVELLGKCGAELIIIPCMTAHYFLPEIQGKTKIPIVDAIKETARAVLDHPAQIKKVGTLATTGTIRSQLFQKSLQAQGVDSLLPSDEDQRELVMQAIYGEDGIKAVFDSLPARERLIAAAKNLIERGADCLVAGCTEIPLVLKQSDLEVPLIDPIKVLGSRAIILCGAEISNSPNDSQRN